jgi:hypothetical protein
MIADTSLSCEVLVSTLKTAPYLLNWGSGVYAQVKAINAYGSSVVSLAGNGAIIITNPDAPVSFIEDYPQRSATILGLTWTEGAFNGGVGVLDYQINYDQGTSTWTVLQT